MSLMQDETMWITSASQRSHIELNAKTMRDQISSLLDEIEGLIAEQHRLNGELEKQTVIANQLRAHYGIHLEDNCNIG